MNTFNMHDFFLLLCTIVLSWILKDIAMSLTCIYLQIKKRNEKDGIH